MSGTRENSCQERPRISSGIWVEFLTVEEMVHISSDWEAAETAETNE
jgi:hypothetical protein